MENSKTVLLTGGAGFIGSALVRHLINNTTTMVVNVDKLTYAGSLHSLGGADASDRHHFHQEDIVDADAMRKLVEQYQPDYIMHLAAESHVDRSIDGPGEFIQTNIVGTYNLLQVAREYYEQLEGDKKSAFKFHHISTDEVYGSLGDTGLFTETTRYKPNSPYSASKASSDHLVRAWNKTYNLPVVISNCSNNYGPYQFPEKLIPVVILKCLSGEPIPVYGKGDNIRDWLYVDDHADALLTVLDKGANGETYNIGGNNERRKIDLVRTICRIMDTAVPREDGAGHDSTITFVTDRPGHDRRYAINAQKIKRDLGWEPSVSFDEGFETTVRWYVENRRWWEPLLVRDKVGSRIGLNPSK